MQQILSHFNESGAYTEESLQPFKERLNSLKQILKQDAADGKHPEPIVRLMEKRLDGVGEYRSQGDRKQGLTVQNANSMRSLPL